MNRRACLPLTSSGNCRFPFGPRVCFSSHFNRFRSSIFQPQLHYVGCYDHPLMTDRPLRPSAYPLFPWFFPERSPVRPPSLSRHSQLCLLSLSVPPPRVMHAIFGIIIVLSTDVDLIHLSLFSPIPTPHLNVLSHYRHTLRMFVCACAYVSSSTFILC